MFDDLKNLMNYLVIIRIALGLVRKCFGVLNLRKKTAPHKAREQCVNTKLSVQSKFASIEFNRVKTTRAVES